MEMRRSCRVALDHRAGGAAAPVFSGCQRFIVTVLILIYIVHVCDDFDGHKKARKAPVRPTEIDRAIGALRATIALRFLCLFVANGLVFGGLGLVAAAAVGSYPD